VAVLFRVIEKNRPTVLADECDAWINDNEELRGLLNAGHKRGGQALRCEGENNEVRAFNVFGPAVLCGIGALPETLHDRSIAIRLERAKPGELRQRFDSRHVEGEAELCRKLARFTADNIVALEASDAKLPNGVFNRLADNWRPLFAIAQVAGNGWSQRAHAAFVALTSSADLDAQGVGTLLLSDIAAIFAAKDRDKLPSLEESLAAIEAGEAADKLPSALLAEKLKEIEGRPWAEWGRQRKPISPNQLANQLRRFGISPRGIRVGDETPRGYLLDDFREDFERYLPKAPPSRLQHRNNAR
jgi:putative DNA primase/helicase